MSYQGLLGDDDEVQGLLFVYHDFQVAFCLEEILSVHQEKRQVQKEAFLEMGLQLCRVVLAIHEKKSESQVKQQALDKYCLPTTLDSILRQRDLYTAYPRPGVRLPMFTEEEEKRKMEAVLEQMKKLELSMGGEMRRTEEIQHTIERRLIQVEGDLLEFNPLDDRNIPRISGVFLCIDQLAGRPNWFMLNVVDGAQRTSYTRKELANICDVQINNGEQGINFIGEARRNGYIPGYLFRVKHLSQYDTLKGLLVKCLHDGINSRGAAAAGSKDRESFDEAYLAGQLAT
jgi:hypothetical protein